MIERSIKNGIRIYQKRSRTYKNKRTINNSNNVIKGIELFKSMTDNDEFKIPEKYYAGPNNNVDLELLRNMNKEEKGLKILTNKQMLNRLSILLVQIQAGNNSIKLKNEIRQILYSLYRSKVLTKTVYNNLIKSMR